MAAPLLLRQTLLRSCFHNYKHFTIGAVTARHRLWCSAAITPPSNKPNDKPNYLNNTLNLRRDNYSSINLHFEDEPDYRKWKDKENEILDDIEPIILLTKEILHSPKYMDGGRLTVEDEKAVVEKLLAYHPHSEDKIGCGLESIMLPNSKKGFLNFYDHTTSTKGLQLIPTSGSLWKVIYNL
ncbi:protein DCL chloroplastic-like [Trifolium pratense]|uniref:Protein DCL chloroplastic-like n=2 Tax=Trifolium pratense TaxID=57577 RepID=A0A2K3NA89_TRIPR|nr:protein DCL chloroplastic-like [Trifolium pratense]PNX99961.1 protein DCL chloroplastic-like [Trifolium pratense]